MRLENGIKQQTDKFVKMYEAIIQKETPVKIKVVVHYSSDDIEFNCDYYQIDVYMNDFKMKTFGDYYHDKGWERCEGYLDGITSFMTDVEIIRENIADYEG